MFHVGQLVVCVDDEDGKYCGQFGLDVPKTGTLCGLTRWRVYTIRDVVVTPSGHDAVRLCEITRAVSRGWESAYSAQRFRPLSPARIAIFRQMLSDVPKETVAV